MYRTVKVLSAPGACQRIANIAGEDAYTSKLLTERPRAQFSRFDSVLCRSETMLRANPDPPFSSELPRVGLRKLRLLMPTALRGICRRS